MKVVDEQGTRKRESDERVKEGWGGYVGPSLFVGVYVRGGDGQL